MSQFILYSKPSVDSAVEFIWSSTAKSGSITLSNGGRTADSSTSLHIVTTDATLVGKAYWETTVSNTSGYSAPNVGLANGSLPFGSYTLGWQSSDIGNSVKIDCRDNFIYQNSGGLVGGFTDSPANDTYRFAVDCATGKVWIGSIGLGVWFGGGNPATDTSPIWTLQAGTYRPVCAPRNGPSFAAVTLNRTALEIVGSVPAGYSTLM